MAGRFSRASTTSGTRSTSRSASTMRGLTTSTTCSRGDQGHFVWRELVVHHNPRRLGPLYGRKSTCSRGDSHAPNSMHAQRQTGGEHTYFTATSHRKAVDPQDRSRTTAGHSLSVLRPRNARPLAQSGGRAVTESLTRVAAAAAAAAVVMAGAITGATSCYGTGCLGPSVENPRSAMSRCNHVPSFLVDSWQHCGSFPSFLVDSWQHC